MSLVLDASVTLSWRFRDESTATADAVLLRVAANGAVAPSVWLLEVANALQTAARRGRVTPAYLDQSLRELEKLPVEIEAASMHRAWTDTLALARAHGLSLYDSAYLELAFRRQLPLASLDAKLRAAGQALGLTLLGV